ncbi:MAG: AMP-binding protein [Rhodoferax sp.]|uniref:AMP-binding protein n=1 Tax=Rhodoferax sp. TaxID=50421 RepID=UPI0026032226|nr:AMP-binding protein [Rhodoferax sp.]MDD5333780.1 AMP-binding protein [Rhodoferax sp.]
MTMNAAQTLLQAGAAQAVALECGDQRLSYQGLRQRVRQAGGAWQALGLRTGERVIIFAPDSIDWVVAYLGAIWAGGVAIGVNPRLAMSELAPILSESEVRFVWCEADSVAPLQQLLADLVQPPALVASGPGVSAWADHLSRAPEVDPVLQGEEAPALWIGTSGTTGVSKGVVHAQRVALQPHSFACGVLGLNASDRLYASSKLFFAYALGNSLLAGLRAGATVILDRHWPDPERVLAMVAQHRPTLLFCVPTLYSKMLQAGVAVQLAGLGIRHCVSAGETLPVAVRQAWRAATGLAITSGYGTSETLCLMLYCQDDSGLLQTTPQVQVRYAPEADPALPQRILLRSSSVALGYWQRPQAQADGFQGGWYCPGDMFLRRADGRLEFAGRTDDLLKISGRWVSTLWVEQALQRAVGDSIAQLACIGVPTAEGLTALSLLAVAAPQQQEVAAQRMQAAMAALPTYRRPHWLHWLAALPLTATGKLQRARLLALHQAAVAGSAYLPLMPSSSTSNSSVALGGMVPPAPRSP